MPKSTNRPHGRRTVYNGITFDSNFEATVAQLLDELNISWEYHPIRIPWVPSVQYYTPDFKINLTDGSSFLLETKGCFDLASRAKMKQLKIQYPNMDIRMMFMLDQPLTKGSPTLYTDWARRHKYKCVTKDDLYELQSSRPRRKRTKQTVRHANSNSQRRTRQSKRANRRTSSPGESTSTGE